MELVAIAVAALLVLGYGLVSRRLESTIVTGPIVFALAGIALGPTGLGLVGDDLDEGALRFLAEATLVLVLFTDAIRIDLRRLREQAALPGRLLGIGLPLTVALGTALAWLLLDGVDLWDAALIAAILSPTDAALGLAVVESPRVPARIRQAINVESGLNDGLMLPAITILLAFAAAEAGMADPPGAGFVARQVGFGVLVGAVVGWGGGRLLDLAASRGWVGGISRQLTTLAIGVGAYALAELAGGNGFVAAFVAGVAFGHAARDHCDGAYEFAVDEGRLLMLLTFLVFGVAIAGPVVGNPDWRVITYAVASLTVIRMVPVALSLVGTGLGRPTVWFVGWFGPRGLASILFALFILEEAELPATDRILEVAAWTIFLSILLHGATSHPLAQRYGAWFESMGDPSMPEAEAVEPMPTRRSPTPQG